MTPPRLPWPAAGAALVAFGALCVTCPGFFLLPLLALGLLGTYAVRARINGRSWAAWMLRVLLWGIVVIITARQASTGGNPFVNARDLYAFGGFCAVELVLQCWRTQPSGGSPLPAAILLSGIVFVSACITFEPRAIRYFGPLYALMTVLSFQQTLYASHSPPTPDATRRRAAGALLAAVALLLALALGAGLHQEIWSHRSELTRWSTSLITPRTPPDITGISTTPTLGNSFNVQSSLGRVMLIENRGGADHLRALAFENYAGSSWGPYLGRRHFHPASRSDLRCSAKGPRAKITRLMEEPHFVYAPLNAAGLLPSKTDTLRWDLAMGGPLENMIPAAGSYHYEVILSSQRDHQGPFCTPLDAATRKRCLEIPREIDPRVRVLARPIASLAAAPRSRVEAVVSYLQTHHTYSLELSPGPGDPISDFLLNSRSAHCQYFASAAAILLRCLGVPSRYISGYYAHETDERGMTIVRQRDAHAWTEAWIDGAGWITVDATPANGRPDQIAGALPFWQKAWEWIQDRSGLLGDRLRTLRPGLLLFLPLLFLPLVFASLLFWRRRRPVPAGQSAFLYSLPDPEFAALAASFNRILQQQKLPCPPSRTWQEHLDVLSETGTAAAFNLAGANIFIQEYNRARFGVAGSKQAVDRLRGALEELESSETRRA